MLLGVIAAIVFIAIGGAIIYFAFGRDTVKGGLGALVAGLVFVFVGLMSFGLVDIEPGHVGVVTVFGQVQEDEIPPGIHWRVPIVNSIIVMDTRVRSVRFENYTAASKEQQDLFLNMTLNYHIKAAAASDIIQNIGQDYEDKIVKPRLLDVPKSITDDYPTTTVLNEREEIRQRSIDALKGELDQFGIVVDNIALENFGYSPEYNAAIEQKQIEQQKVQTEQQVLEQRRIQAQQAVVKAQGEADAAIETARGQAEANRLLTESLTGQLLQWQAIQKLNPNVQVMLVPSDQGFILDLKSLTPTQAPTP